MKLCLINPPINQHQAPLEIPLQLLILATIACEVDWETQIIDFNLLTKYDPRFPLSGRFFNPAIEYISSHHPDLIGISCISSSMPASLEIARIYKERFPSCKVILGGPHATLLHDKILEKFHFIDLICRGEGELTFKELLAEGIYSNFGNIPGISFRNKLGKVIVNVDRAMLDDLDQIPIPDYDLINIGIYKKIAPGISLTIEAGRGCPYECAYCATSLVWNRKFRLKTIQRLLSEVEQAVNKTGITSIHFIHDLFSLNKKWVLELCENIRSKNMNIQWGCDTRIDAVSSELLMKMSGCGCRHIFFGLESGSINIQNKMGKVVDHGKSIDIISEAVDMGINTTVSFILGYPSEKLDELNSTIEYIVLLLGLRLHGLVINTFTPEYGTEGYRLCQDGLKQNEYIIRKDQPFIIDDILNLILSNHEIFSHFYYPDKHPYEFQMLIDFINVLPIISFLDDLQNIIFHLSKRRIIDILLEFHDFIKESLHFDEYYNVKYESEELFNGLNLYLSYIKSQHCNLIINFDEKLMRSKIEEITHKLNNDDD